MPIHEIQYTDRTANYITFSEFIRLAGLVAAGAADADGIAAEMCGFGTRIQLTETEGGCDVASYTAAEAYNAYWTWQLHYQAIGEDAIRLEHDAVAMWVELIEQTARAVDHIAARILVPVLDAPGVRGLHLVR
jgi:hypothetical protein